MAVIKKAKQRIILQNHEGIIALSKKLSSGDKSKGLKILFLAGFLFKRISFFISDISSSKGVHSDLVKSGIKNKALDVLSTIADEIKELLNENCSVELRQDILEKFTPLAQLIDRLNPYHEILIRYSINELITYKRNWIEELESFIELSKEDFQNLRSSYKNHFKEELEQFILGFFEKYKYLLRRNQQFIQNNYTASNSIQDQKLARNLLLLPRQRQSKSDITALLDLAYKNEYRNITKEKKKLDKLLEAFFLSISSEEGLNRENDKQIQKIMKALKIYLGQRKPKSLFFQGKSSQMKPFNFSGIKIAIEDVFGYIKELYEAAKENKANTTSAIAEQVILYSFLKPHLSLEKAIEQTESIIDIKTLRKNKSEKEDECFFKPLAETILKNYKFQKIK